MDYVRCPQCKAWIPPNAGSCTQCGAATAKTGAAPPRSAPQVIDLRLESAARLRRLSSTCWGVMWAAFIAQIFCGIRLMQANVNESQASSESLALVVSLAFGVVLAIAVVRLADEAETKPVEQFFLFFMALIIPLAAMLIARRLRTRLSSMAKELESQARAPAAST